MTPPITRTELVAAPLATGAAHARLVRVEIPPGTPTGRHRHPRDVVGYRPPPAPPSPSRSEPAVPIQQELDGRVSDYRITFEHDLVAAFRLVLRASQLPAANGVVATIVLTATLTVTLDRHGGIGGWTDTRRLSTENQRLAMGARDHGCSFPGCTVPPLWCSLARPSVVASDERASSLTARLIRTHDATTPTTPSGWAECRSC